MMYDDAAYVRHEIIKDLFDKAREEGAKVDDKFKALCAEKQVPADLAQFGRTAL